MITRANMMDKLKVMTGESDESLLSVYLDIAASAVCRRCYPYAEGAVLVPPKYLANQLEIAVYLYNKRGAEGEKAHNENGINRSYESASVPESMLRNVIPIAKTFSTGGRFDAVSDSE